MRGAIPEEDVLSLERWRDKRLGREERQLGVVKAGIVELWETLGAVEKVVEEEEGSYWDKLRKKRGMVAS